jgi:DNA (cytosine-5)-methyltransferase 1
MKAIWSKADYPKEKNGYKVYSCFACGGGSTMGYKLAGFEVIGANDIDPEMAKIYQTNHNPKHYHLMDIRSLVKEENLPKEMFDLDILDGSPPCSSFSMSGSREEKWGEKKKFREGQAEQTLDDLFFDFIDLAKRLQPKVVIAENVKGLISGNAKRYVVAINEAFDEAGYDAQLFLLNGSSMGVPQRRERVFFIARRKDLNLPKMTLDFTDKPVYFGDIRTDKGIQGAMNPETKMYEMWTHRKKSDANFSSIAKRLYNKASYFSETILHDDKIPPTLVSGSAYYLYDKAFQVSSADLISIQSFPQDYDFIKPSYNFIKYVLGMSVPPLMTMGVAKQVELQLLSKLK